MLKFVLLLIYLNLVLGDIECPPNYLLFEDGLCYQFLSEAAVHKIPGQHKCESEGGNLPKISGILQNAIVTNISLNATDVTWLGLTCSRDDTCIWDDGTKMNYSNFDSGLADVSQGNCVFINILPAKRGKWSSADCASDLKDVICQTNQKSLQPNITCPDTYIKGSDDRCYLSPNFKLEFNNAENLCSETASNSHLTSISSREENNATQLISQAAHFTDIFIGLEAGSKGYVWIDGTQFNYPYSYSNFEDGQPNIKVGNCVAMNVTTGKWKSICCNQKTSFVCLQKC
uniref:C-type lectin domain-containing protein n=1 Tax=Panagrolaimus superbus TaxID=310955 RepID=A0A914YZ97_9BILA